MFNTAVEFFQQGGPFMYPIALVLFTGLAIAVEKFIYLKRNSALNNAAFDAMYPHLSLKHFDKAFELTSQYKCGVSSVIGAGIARMSTASHKKSANKREDVEYAVEEGLMETMPKLQDRIPYLATLANIATLLGLLGTIIGLISAFTAVADADPTEKAKLLSLSISVAMNTTAFGLMTAIPLLICHALLQTSTTGIVDKLEMVCVQFLNIIDSDDKGTKDLLPKIEKQLNDELNIEFA